MIERGKKNTNSPQMRLMIAIGLVVAGPMGATGVAIAVATAVVPTTAPHDPQN